MQRQVHCKARHSTASRPYVDSIKQRPGPQIAVSLCKKRGRLTGRGSACGWPWNTRRAGIPDGAKGGGSGDGHELAPSYVSGGKVRGLSLSSGDGMGRCRSEVMY